MLSGSFAMQPLTQPGSQVRFFAHSEYIRPFSRAALYDKQTLLYFACQAIQQIEIYEFSPLIVLPTTLTLLKWADNCLPVKKSVMYF